MSYHQKYLKYKQKYLLIKKQYGGKYPFWIIENNGEELGSSRYSGQYIWISIRDFINYNANIDHTYVYTLQDIRNIASNGHIINGEKESWNQDLSVSIKSLEAVLKYFPFQIYLYHLQSDESIDPDGVEKIGDDIAKNRIIHIVESENRFYLITKINDKPTMSLTPTGTDIQHLYNSKKKRDCCKQTYSE